MASGVFTYLSTHPELESHLTVSFRFVVPHVVYPIVLLLHDLRTAGRYAQFVSPYARTLDVGPSAGLFLRTGIANFFCPPLLNVISVRV